VIKIKFLGGLRRGGGIDYDVISIENKDELDETIERVVARIVIQDADVQRCKMKYSGIQSPRYATPWITGPRSILIYDEKGEEVLRLIRDEVSISLPPKDDSIKLHVPVFETSSVELFEDDYILMTLYLFGSIYKRVNSALYSDPEYIYEQMIIFDIQEIESFSRMLDALPRDLRLELKYEFNRNTCWPDVPPHENYYADKVLVNPFFFIQETKESATSNDLPINLIRKWIEEEVSSIIKLPRHRRYLKLLLPGESIFDLLNNMYLLIDFLKVNLASVEYYTNYTFDLLEAFSYLLHYLNMNQNDEYNYVLLALVKGRTGLATYLTQLERLVWFFEKSIDSIEFAFDRVTELVRNDLLTSIEITLISLSIISFFRSMFP